MISSAPRARSRASESRARHCGSTDSAIRRRSFHKEILRQEHRSALDLVFRLFQGASKRWIVGNVDGFAQRQILIVRDQDRDRAAVSGEERSFAGQLTL